MIDLHAHVLPELDDGARSLEEALEMGRIAVADGIREMVATPHHTELNALPSPLQEAKARLRGLQEALQRERVPLTLHLGAEVNLVPELPDLLVEGRLFPLGPGPYVLVHWDTHPVHTEEVLFALELRGYIPIIAHPERSAAVERDPDFLARLVERGALCQITAASIAGGFGPRVKALAEQLLRRRLVHFIASDAHSAERLYRAPYLAEGVEAAARIVGWETAEAMVTTWPEAVLRGQRLEVERPLPAERRFWRFWRRG
jgi:protein-tyrosine phosphatase